jgi:hypothetical protein
MGIVAGRLINLTSLANLKGCLLITFENGVRHTIPVASQDHLMQPLLDVARDIERAIEDEQVRIPDILN